MRAFGLFGSVANELHFCHCAGCRTFFAHLCAHLLRSAVLYLSVLKHRVDRLQTYFFLPCLSSDCAGVWPFRIRCQRALFLSLCKAGCPTIFAHLCAHQAAAVVCVCAYVLGLLSFPLGVPKVPLRPLGNDRFLLCLSPDLDGVQPFRIHCQAAAVLRLCGLGCVTFFANDWCSFLFL